MAEIDYMNQALELSKLGASLTHPNPMVGAVIVKDGRIIGAGWHHGPGLPHAEVEAIKSCETDPAGATMYVTLEPCNHWGRTPPCTEAVLKAGITTVKIAVRDPNPRVTGGGIARLTAAGIKVEAGLGAAEAAKINRSYFYHCQTGRPWVIWKSAASLDGKITSSNGESQWITGPAARKLVHQLRSQVGAVLIGSGTMLQDNPQLTNRLVEPVGRQPLKVVLDSELRIPLDSNLLLPDPANLWVFCTEKAGREKEQQLRQTGVKVTRQAVTGRVDLGQALESLGSANILSVLVEGGSEIFAGFRESDLVNEYYLFYGPFLIGGSQAKNIIGGVGVNSLQEVRRLRVESLSTIGEDVLIHAFKD